MAQSGSDQHAHVTHQPTPPVHQKGPPGNTEEAMRSAVPEPASPTVAMVISGITRCADASDLPLIAFPPLLSTFFAFSVGLSVVGATCEVQCRCQGHYWGAFLLGKLRDEIRLDPVFLDHGGVDLRLSAADLRYW